MHSFLSSALGGGEWHLHAPAASFHRKNASVRSVGDWVGPQSQSSCFEDERNLFPAEILTQDHSAHSLVTILTELSQFNNSTGDL